MTELIIAFRNFANAPKKATGNSHTFFCRGFLQYLYHKARLDSRHLKTHFVQHRRSNTPFLHTSSDNVYRKYRTLPREPSRTLTSRYPVWANCRVVECTNRWCTLL